MSKLETPMTEAFWQLHANGAFLPEYPLVRRSADCSRRLCDAAILPDEAHGRARLQDYPSLSGRNVILVQTKCRRMAFRTNSLRASTFFLRSTSSSSRAFLSGVVPTGFYSHWDRQHPGHCSSWAENCASCVLLLQPHDIRRRRRHDVSQQACPFFQGLADFSLVGVLMVDPLNSLLAVTDNHFRHVVRHFQR